MGCINTQKVNIKRKEVCLESKEEQIQKIKNLLKKLDLIQSDIDEKELSRSSKNNLLKKNDLIEICLKTLYQRLPVENCYHEATITRPDQNSNLMRYTIGNGMNWGLTPEVTPEVTAKVLDCNDQKGQNGESITLITDEDNPYPGENVTLFSDRFIFLGETFYALQTEEFKAKLNKINNRIKEETDKESKELNARLLKLKNEKKNSIDELNKVFMNGNRDELLEAFKIESETDFNKAYQHFSFLFEALSLFSIEKQLDLIEELGNSSSKLITLRLQYTLLGLLGKKYSNDLQSSTANWILFDNYILYQLLICGEFLPDQVLFQKNYRLPPVYHSKDYARNNPDSDYNINSSQQYWYNVLSILDNISKNYTEIKTNSNSIQTRLACSVAIQFGTPTDVPQDWIGYPSVEKIKPLDRFKRFLRVYEEGKLLPCFKKLSTWHLGLTINSFRTDEELDWCIEGENIPSNLKTQDQINNACGLVQYIAVNSQGVSIHEGGEKYYGVKQTSLKHYKEKGGVCGAISFFGSGACQAFGIPSIIAGQPAHCAFLWLNTNNKFILGNDNSGWEKTEINQKYAWLYELMSDCQINQDKFFKSENLRLFASILSNVSTKSSCQLLKLACEECPSNFRAWTERISAINRLSITGLGSKDTSHLEFNLNSLNYDQNCYIIDLKNQRISSGEEIKDLVEIRKITINWCDVNSVSLHNENNLNIPTKYILSTSKDGITYKEVRSQFHERKSEKAISPLGYKIFPASGNIVWYQLDNNTCVIPGWSKGKPDTRFLKIQLLTDFSKIKNMDITLSLMGANLKEEASKILSIWNNDNKCNFNNLQISNLNEDVNTDDLALFCKTKVSSTTEGNCNDATDGTGDNFWGTSESEAEFEIDLASVFNVNEIKIKWWASCYSDNFTITTSLKDGSHSKQRANKSNAVQHPNNIDDWNAYTVIPLSATGEYDTQIIKISMKDGHKDPWRANEGKASILLGIRSINIYGKSKEGPPNITKEALIMKDSITRLIDVNQGRAYACLNKYLESFPYNIFAGYDY